MLNGKNPVPKQTVWNPQSLSAPISLGALMVPVQPLTDTFGWIPGSGDSPSAFSSQKK